MITVGNRQFNSWEEVSAFAEEQKKAEIEAKAKAQAEEEEKVKVAQEVYEEIKNHLVAGIVTQDGVDTLILACIKDADTSKGSHVTRTAIAEELFGSRYAISGKGVTENYSIRKLEVTDGLVDIAREGLLQIYRDGVHDYVLEGYNGQLGDVCYNKMYFYDLCGLHIEVGIKVYPDSSYAKCMRDKSMQVNVKSEPRHDGISQEGAEFIGDVLMLASQFAGLFT